MRHVWSWQYPHTTSKKIVGIKAFPYGVCFKCGKLTTGQETALAASADSMLSNPWNSITQRKSTAKLHQENIRKSFNIPASQKMGAPTLQRNLAWLSRYLATSVISTDVDVISTDVEATCFALPVYSHDSYSSLVSDRVED